MVSLIKLLIYALIVIIVFLVAYHCMTHLLSICDFNSLTWFSIWFFSSEIRQREESFMRVDVWSLVSLQSLIVGSGD